MLGEMVAVVGMSLLVGTAAVAADAGTILQVTGRIAGETVALEHAELQELPQIELETSTVVTDGTHKFTGFLMRDLMENLRADGDRVTAVALNDYAVDIPMADFYDYDVIVAYSMDDIPLGRDDKGPLWIVYPRDDHQELQDIRYDYRWVWQLSRLEVQ
ncbi:molybdopterin-dependent oxidoreductase [Pontibaca salina]|uniref:Molybdopterin-dependent oxidoreductase n=1 Tax=Pontibaca salina TaxID=2795731 RepID=A0A934LZL4_9RHOB|nr:molybdopterin-dependent oxidoreductase [Pontibaca salina]MBI6629110.1 molybdopterin-dependent oxidoreductase [Pontibaca salina]